MIIQVKNPIIEIHNLTVGYQSQPVLWNVDCSFAGGQLVGIVGPNGSGKSTLLKSIMGLVAPRSGYIKIFDNALNDVRNKISYVPQRETVDWDFPASVLDVVLMGRYNPKNIWQRTTKADLHIAHQSLEKVNLQDYAKRQIAQLSGGQQQRVFIARALAQQADLYIMDEPFAGVDAATEAAILEILMDLKQQGKTVVMVHHDLQTAQEFFDWIILLSNRLVASAPTAAVLTPELLQEAYGGKLTILSRMAEVLKQK